MADLVSVQLVYEMDHNKDLCSGALQSTVKHFCLCDSYLSKNHEFPANLLYMDFLSLQIIDDFNSPLPPAESSVFFYDVILFYSYIQYFPKASCRFGRKYADSIILETQNNSRYCKKSKKKNIKNSGNIHSYQSNSVFSFPFPQKINSLFNT